MIQATNLNNYGYTGRIARVAVINTGIDAQKADFKAKLFAEQALMIAALV